MDGRSISKGEWKKTTHTRKLLSVCVRKMRRPVFKQMFRNTGNHFLFCLEQNRFKIPYTWIHRPFHCLPGAYVSSSWWREWAISGRVRINMENSLRACHGQIENKVCLGKCTCWTVKAREKIFSLVIRPSS